MGVIIGLVAMVLIVLARRYTMRRWMRSGGNIDRIALVMVVPLYLVIMGSTVSGGLDRWTADPFYSMFTLALLGGAFLFAWWVMAAMMRSFAAIAPDDPPARPEAPQSD